jgi:hypothetical protein
VDIDALNFWLSVATIAVVVGVLLEGAEHWDDIRKRGWKPVIPKIGFFILIVGLAGEWKFQSLIGQADTQFRVGAIKQMAALNKEAADARLETAKIEKEYGPRKLTEEQLQSLADKAKPFAGTEIIFSVNTNDTESANFAMQIASPLKEVGWQTSGGTFWGGITIHVGISMNSTDDAKSVQAASVLISELDKDGFPVELGPTDAPNGQFGHRTGKVWVTVNPRPLPMFSSPK